jgi:hypothetical protein
MPFLGWGMCRWHLGFSLVVSHKGFVTFLSFPPTLKFSTPPNLLLFDLHLYTWDTFKARFFRVSIGSPSLLTSLSFHLQRWDRSCLCGGYCPSNVFGKLGTCCPNHHIQFFSQWPSIFIGGYKANNLNSLPFQAHLKWVHDLLPLATQTSIPPFEHLLEGGKNCLQKNISKNMHKHSFSNIISKLSIDCHCVRLKSYVGPSLGVWLSSHLIIPSFNMASNIFSSTLHTKLGLPHPTTCGLF